MDERALFDQFHEALDIEPRPGAADLLVLQLTRPPVAAMRRPAFHTRWTKMGFRLSAAMTAVVIAIALIAAFLASHNAAVGNIQARPDPTVKPYQTMMRSDYAAFDQVTNANNHCGTIQDTGCAGAVSNVVPVMQKWINDLTTTPTPSQYAVLNGQLRRHLTQVITDLNAATRFQAANDAGGFNLALNSALFERAWIDPTTFALEGSYRKVAGSYRDAIALVRQSLDTCVNGRPDPAALGCSQLSSTQQLACSGPTCLGYAQNADTDLQMLLIALAQNPAPSSVKAKAAQLQTDLANADTNLVAYSDALLKSDIGNADVARNAFGLAVNVADSDAGTLAYS